MCGVLLDVGNTIVGRWKWFLPSWITGGEEKETDSIANCDKFSGATEKGDEREN